MFVAVYKKNSEVWVRVKKKKYENNGALWALDAYSRMCIYIKGVHDETETRVKKFKKKTKKRKKKRWCEMRKKNV